MKKTRIVCIVLALCAGSLASCAGEPGVRDEPTARSASEAVANPAASNPADTNPADFNPLDFSEVLEKTWELIEVKSDSGVTPVERQDTRDMYTARFAEGRVSGKAAPNGYSASYTVGNFRDISFGHIVSTKMAALQEPESLKEHEYFSYLAKTAGWEIRAGQLILFTSGDSGDVLLVYNEIEHVD